MRARTRTKTAVDPLAPGRCSVRFVELPTSPVLKLDCDDGRPVDGAFVRLAPRLRRSERGAFDAALARQTLKSRGAVVVVTSPVLIPDESGSRPARQRHVDERAELRAWFGDSPDAEATEALDGCLRIVDELRF